MTIAYFDCYSGVAGDMVLGAMIDLGMSLDYLKKELKKLKLSGYRLEIKKRSRHAIGGTNLHVAVLKEPNIRHYRDIVRLVRSSRLKTSVKKSALDIFEVLGRAEAKVHRRKLSYVHFHEVGGLDSIVDIVGAAIGLDYFGFEKIYVSPLPITRGYVTCAHGRLPIPAPATLEVLKGVPLEPAPVKREIVTPTGASILKAIAHGFGSSPIREIEKIGYGFGDLVIPKMPNALRLIAGKGMPLIALEANIDDMNPELYPYIIEKLLDDGAIDAGLIPMVMKKGRPGAILHVLCEEGDRKSLSRIILKETTTFGLRYFPIERAMVEREIKKVKTKYGVVGVKVARYEGDVVTVAPEYSDCEKIAKRKKMPLKEVYRQAMIKS